MEEAISSAYLTNDRFALERCIRIFLIKSHCAYCTRRGILKRLYTYLITPVKECTRIAEIHVTWLRNAGTPRTSRNIIIVVTIIGGRVSSDRLIDANTLALLGKRSQGQCRVFVTRQRMIITCTSSSIPMRFRYQSSTIHGGKARDRFSINRDVRRENRLTEQNTIAVRNHLFCPRWKVNEQHEKSAAGDPRSRKLWDW